MDARQLWVRNADGKVWGPLPAKMILTMIERKLIVDLTESSHDGQAYGPVADEPALAPALAKLAAFAAARQKEKKASQTAWSPAAAAPPAAEALPELEALPPMESFTLSPEPSPATERPELSSGASPPAAAASLASMPTEAWRPPTGKIIQAVLPSGRLEEHSPLKLYYLIAVAEAQGRLILGDGEAMVLIWFKAGTPHAVESPQLSLGTYLIEQRVLSTAQFATAAPQIQNAGGDVASGLFAAGLLNPQTGFPMIQQHAQTVLQKGLLLDHGPFMFDPTVPVPASGFQVGQRWQLLVAAARKIDVARLTAWKTGREGMVPKVAGSTAELQLTAQEIRLLGSLDGTRTLEQAIVAAGPQALNLERLALFLSEIDRVTWTGALAASSGPEPTILSPPPPVEPPGGLSAAIAKAMAEKGKGAPAPAASAEPKPSPKSKPPIAIAPPPPEPPTVKPTTAAAKPATPAAKPKPAAPPAKGPTAAAASSAPTAKPTAAPAASPPVDVKSLQKLLEELRGQDLFARLKVERNKKPIPTLKTNYFQLAKIYHPDTVPPDGPEEARKIKADILSLLNEASNVLQDDAKRAEYLDELEAKEAVGDVDVEAIQAILAAEEDFQQAMILAKNRRFAEALVMIENCIQTNPNEGEFYAWRGYCKFFAARDKKQFRDAALEDQKKALQINPRCAVAWQFQGAIWKLLEDHAKAKEAFQKTLELDKGNTEAQRELRLYEQRKR